MVPRLPRGFTHPVPVGRGSFASVYRARQEGTDRWVAIKIISEKNGQRRKQLLREAKVQAKIELDCIPRVYDAFEWRSNVCIVMQWVKGVSLQTLLETSLTVPERLVLARTFIGALAQLHALGFVHRDIKPANVLITPERGLFLVDFGFTKNMGDRQMSLVATAKGTPAYMAPELWEKGSAADLMRADVYSAGKVIAQLLGEERLARFFRNLIEEHPENRPASGEEILSQWNSIPDLPSPPQQSWPPSVAPLSSRELSARLVAAAKQLSCTGRHEEAYWLLVEALEEYPDSAEAVRLMSDFSRLSGRRFGGTWLRIAVAAATAAIVVTAFYTGKRSSTTVLTEPTSAARTKARGKDLVMEPHARNTPLFSGAVLKEHSRRADRLSGRLIIVNIPAEGTLTLDGHSSGTAAEWSDGIAVSYGSHTLAWHDEKGAVGWRERLFILPFQTKAIGFTPANKDAS